LTHRKKTPPHSSQLENQSSSDNIRIIANTKLLATFPNATIKASSKTNQSAVTSLHHSVSSSVSTSNLPIRDQQTNSAASKASNKNASRANHHQKCHTQNQHSGSTKLSGSITKPSAANPFNISLSDEKLTGEPIISLLTSTIPPGIQFRTSDITTIHQIQSSRHLPQVETLLPPPQPCPVQQSESPSWLIPTIREIISTPACVLAESPFIFNLTSEAATHNMLVLLAYESNIQTVIDNHQHTILKHGSEIRSVSILQCLLMHHPKCPKIQSLLTSGSLWPLTPISDNDRQAKNTELI
jgi:hypothetical protein